MSDVEDDEFVDASTALNRKEGSLKGMTTDMILKELRGGRTLLDENLTKLVRAKRDSQRDTYLQSKVDGLRNGITAVGSKREFLDLVKKTFEETDAGPQVNPKSLTNDMSIGQRRLTVPWRWLERQIHPFVRDRVSESIESLAASTWGLRDGKGVMAPGDCPTGVLAIPLLFEAQMMDLVTEIWVVYLRQEKQIERLMLRDRLTREEAIVRINAQMSLEEKCQKADVILDNSSTRLALLEQIDLALGRLQLPKHQ